MKKGVFGSWFRELATLVFTQTIQAFLLAIVMTIVISAMGAANNNGSTDGKSGTNYAAGMLAIIALSQFGKIEHLVKQIFGVQSQFGDPAMQNGKGGLLAGAMALKYGKKVLNNGGKIIGGIGGAAKSTMQIRNLDKQKKALGAIGDADAAEGAAQEALNGMENAADKFIGDAATGAGMATGAQVVGGTGNGGTGISSSQIDQLIQAVKQQTSALEKSKSDSDKDKANDKIKALDDKIEEARKNRRQSIRTAASGVNETLAAGVGASVGAVVGLGMGDDVVRNAVIGAGVGDSAASGAMKIEANISEGIRDVKRDNKKTRDMKLDLKIDEANERKSKAEKDKAVYTQMTNQLNTAMKNKSYMKNSTSKERARVVKKLEENVRGKYDASNM